MNPYGIGAGPRIDEAELKRWNAANKKSRAEYAANPISHARTGRCTRTGCGQPSGSAPFCRSHRSAA